MCEKYGNHLLPVVVTGQGDRKSVIRVIGNSGNELLKFGERI